MHRLRCVQLSMLIVCIAQFAPQIICAQNQNIQCTQHSSNLPAALASMAIGYCDTCQSVFLMGGTDAGGGYTDEVYEWDSASPPSWFTNIATPAPIVIHSRGVHITASVGTVAYVASPKNNLPSPPDSALYPFDMNNKQWLSPIPFSTPSGTDLTVPCVSHNGTHIILFDGYQPSRSNGQLYVLLYAISRDEWTTQSVNTPFGGSGKVNAGWWNNMCVYAKGFLYIFGGRVDTGSTSYIDGAYKYDLESQTFTTLPSLPTTHVYSTALYDGGNYIYLPGGRVNSCCAMDEIRIFDVTADVWSGHTMTTFTPVGNAPSMILGSELWIFGGKTSTGDTTDTVHKCDISSLLVTSNPTTNVPTTPAPITPAPITPIPTTAAPTTTAPTTPAPITSAPTTRVPTTVAPTTTAPTTTAPTTPVPTTVAPTTPAPITPVLTTTAPTTTVPTAPTSPLPTTGAPSAAPTTTAPTTVAPSSAAPTTRNPTTFGPSMDASSVDDVVAWWSCSYLKMYIDIDDAFILNLAPLVDNVCSEMFDAATAALLGANAACSWSNNGEHTITIALSSSSSIAVNDTLVIKHETFEYEKHQQRLRNPTIVISEVRRECMNTAPVIRLDTPSQIGICDDVVLDTRHNVAVLSGLGGRAPARLEWDIALNSGAQVYTVVDADRVRIASADMDAGQAMEFVLRVTPWYDAQATTAVNGTIYKASQVVPSIQLLYASTFDAHTTMVSIESAITFTDSCLNNHSNVSASSFFRFSWSVDFVSDSDDDGVAKDTDLFARLQSVMESSTERTLTINNEYLQNGAAYAFTLSIDCDTTSNIYDCSSVSAPALISHRYSHIVCQISGGNKALSVAESVVDTVLVPLIGDEWSFDPDGNNALTYMWSCQAMNDATNNDTELDCSSLLTFLESPRSALFFANASLPMAVGQSYTYRIGVTVSDASVPSRADCQDSITVQLGIIDDADASELVVRYLVSISATSTSISNTDRLRLVSSLSLLNGEPVTNDDDDDELLYEWSLANDALTVDEINEYRLNARDAKHLVMHGSSLQSGRRYDFMLNVFDRDAPDISVGNASISIDVRSPPVIYDDGFVIDDSLHCNFSFDQLLDSFFHSLDLYVSADGDETPLAYEFEVMFPSPPLHDDDDDAYRLHSNALLQPLLQHVLLPVDCNYSVQSSVTDAEGTQTSQSISCCLTVSHHNCFSYQSDVIDVYFAAHPLLSNADKYRYIFQSVFNLLHYLPTIDDDDTECKNAYVADVLQVLNANFASTAIDFCASSHFYSVIELAQLLRKLLTTAADAVLLPGEKHVDCAEFDILYDLITQALDPCEFIRENISDTDDLHVSQQSVLTNTIAILYEDVDITQHLSALLTDERYLYLVHDVIEVFVDYLSIPSSNACMTAHDDNPRQQVVAFLETVLHISGLAGMSTTISSEYINIESSNFQVLSIRDDHLSSLNVSVLDDVAIELDTTSNGGDATTDIIISALKQPSEKDAAFASSSPLSNSTASDDDIDCLEHSGGVLGEQHISITIVNSTADTTIDVNITFEQDLSGASGDTDNDNNNVVCVWWDEESNEWRSDGCQAIVVDAAQNIVMCRCDHLTTFATISNLKKRTTKECNAAIDMDSFLSDDFLEIMLAFAGAFFFIFAGLFFNFCRYKCYGVSFKKMFRQRSMQVLSATALVALFYSFRCVVFYVQFLQIPSLLIVILLLPLILYYLIFSFLIGTWIDVVHAMRTNDTIKRFQKSLRWCTLIVCQVYAVIIILLLVLDDDDEFADIIKIGELFWISIMTLSVVLYTFYGARVVRTIYVANMAVQKKETKSALQRISIAVIGLDVFFTAQCAQTVYFSWSPQQLNVYWILADLALNWLCLLLICVLYLKAWRALLTEQTTSDSSWRKRGHMRKKEKVESKTGTSREEEDASSRKPTRPARHPRTKEEVPSCSPLSSPRDGSGFFPGFGEHKVQMSNRYLSAAPRTVAAAPVAASNFNTLPTITFYGSQRTVMNAPLGLHSLGDVSADGDNVFAGAGDQETQADNDWEYYYEEEEEE